MRHFKKETQIYQYLHKTLPSFHWQRIEPAINAGVPDLNYAAPNGVEGWLELKTAVLNSEDPNHVIYHGRLRASQYRWLTVRVAKNKRCFVLTGTACGRLFLAGPAHWEKIRSGMVREVCHLGIEVPTSTNKALRRLLIVGSIL